VTEQGLSGETGHSGPSGERFDDRLRRHGVRARSPPRTSPTVRRPPATSCAN
jgi:hypothetical protein